MTCRISSHMPLLCNVLTAWIDWAHLLITSLTYAHWLTCDQRRRRVWRFRRGPGDFVISGCLAPTPTLVYEKNLTGFLRFTWTPVNSSGGSGPQEPHGQLRRCMWLVMVTLSIFKDVTLRISDSAGGKLTRLERFAQKLSPQTLFYSAWGCLIWPTVLRSYHFLPCDAMRCTVFVIVILSVCLSVTLVDCVHMVRPTIMISSPYGSPIILVSGDITFIPKFEGGTERGRWMRVGWVQIGDFRPISRRISETVRDTTKVTINH